MRIVHLSPGSGGTFYCQNCLRDTALVRALRAQGHDVVIVPMYLPLMADGAELVGKSPVFFGAINVYLKEKMPLLRHSPAWLRRALDSRKLLEWAARKSGSTRSHGLEEMTLSMLRGEEGRQAVELDQLMTWLSGEEKADVIHLSSVLLVGLARAIKKRLGVPVVCSLQDEHTWLDAMDPEYAPVVWETLIDRCREVDAFISVSKYFGDLMKDRLQVPAGRMHVVPVGVDLAGYEQSSLPFMPPVLGYLSRMCESCGLGVLVEAFIQIKQHSELRGLRLAVTGGQTGDDVRFIRMIKKRLVDVGMEHEVRFEEDFDRPKRQEFLKKITVMSVPSPSPEAFGSFIIEAQACGVPVVQPEMGAFPELLAATGGGVLYEPGDMDQYVDALKSLLLNPQRTQDLGRRGRDAVRRHFGIENMARNTLKVYEGCLS